MKKSIPLIISAVLLLSACQETLEERCEREAHEYTQKKCPVYVTDLIMLDSLTFDKATHTMRYYYTLDGVMDDKVALERHDLRTMLLKELKNTTNVDLYKEAGYTFRYTYFSKSKKGTQLFDATFRQKDYR